jgi:RNA polymerase-binding transcription factor DksA
MKAAQAQLERSQILMDSLQSRINALTTDYVNRDDPAQRAKIEGDRKAALAELERVRKEVDDAGKAIKALEDDARRAGVPPGWLRPGA